MTSAGTSLSRPCRTVVQVELVDVAFGDQHHQRHADQDLVGDGIQHAAEIASRR